MIWTNMKVPVGTVRVIKRFAWFVTPLDFPKNHRVWFSYYYEKQYYGQYYTEFKWYVLSRHAECPIISGDEVDIV